MARRVAKILAATTVCGALAGCGLMLFEKREPWRSEAEEACLAQKLVEPSAYVEPMRAINGPGACGMDHPFRLSAFAGGTVGLKSKAILACPAVSMVDRWLAEVVQPAASLYFGTSVAELRAGSYSCRSMNGQPGARRSEHSFGNAVDVMAFRLADGREVSVVKGWRGAEAEQEFLREVFVGACNYFTTVLAPGSDAFHYDHIHMDLARHARGRTICKPILKFTPRLPPPGSPDYGRTPVAASRGGYGEAGYPGATPGGGPPMTIHDGYRQTPAGEEVLPDEEVIDDAANGAGSAPSQAPAPRADAYRPPASAPVVKGPPPAYGSAYGSYGVPPGGLRPPGTIGSQRY
ncbi:extensin family protein [Chelatococcus sp. SYSU_G07232]|uniref:Extensin family protein n=1 Tax=Chelatococcus albus TaxID=3047466 RepID=A0ABT7AIS2_9HYPH|nr:extensin family protein [Chelatococcus sp. SYSU_G07232]MDJ1159267.1 extensin family protein [Chelatococcus sp. SYSU_G07232]